MEKFKGRWKLFIACILRQQYSLDTNRLLLSRTSNVPRSRNNSKITEKWWLRKLPSEHSSNVRSRRSTEIAMPWTYRRWPLCRARLRVNSWHLKSTSTRLIREKTKSSPKAISPLFLAGFCIFGNIHQQPLNIARDRGHSKRRREVRRMRYPCVLHHHHHL